VIVGLNRVFEHEGRQFHVQVEDLGEDRGCYEVRVHQGGGVVWRKTVGYEDILAKNLPKGERDEAVSGSMEKTLHTVWAAIIRGKLP